MAVVGLVLAMIGGCFFDSENIQIPALIVTAGMALMTMGIWRMKTNEN